MTQWIAPPTSLRSISARKAAGEPFALATVVRKVAATAADAGAKAVILPNGTISEGWIGGGCAREVVLKAAKDALADGKSRLVCVQSPDLLDQQGHRPGALEPWRGAGLTLGNEIDKLAGNIALGRDAAGVHYRSDSVRGLFVGRATGPWTFAGL